MNLNNIVNTNVPKIITDKISNHIADTDLPSDKELRTACGITIKGWKVIFTSGREQSNEIIISNAIESFRREVNSDPHLIVSAAEHPSMIDYLRKIKKIADITFIPTDLQGNIIPEMIQRFIKPNTCLISIIYVQEDTGVVNNIQSIAQIAKDAHIPFHTDATQYFARVKKVQAKARNISALTLDGASFHAPKGIGALVVDEKFIDGYKMDLQQPQINPGLAYGLIEAIKHPTLRGCNVKVISSLRRLIINTLDSKYARGDFNKYKKTAHYKPKSAEYVLISPEKGAVIPNILTFAIMGLSKPFDADKFVKTLSEKNIFIGTPSKFVMGKLGFKQELINSCIRISTSSDTKITWVKAFLKQLPT